MSFLNRRDFIKDSAVLAALAGAGVIGKATAVESAKAVKAADGEGALRVAVIGVHGRGRSHIEGFAGKNNCVVSVICDVDSGVIGGAMTQAEKAQGSIPKYEQDLRKVVEDKDIDVVSIATPNHWHSLAAIWALQNDKDVYVEKPVSHNVSEGRRVVDFARKQNRVCQAGTQIRSSAGVREAVQFLHDGKLGKISLARALCYKPRVSIGKVNGPQQPPATMDYDLWCGPAPHNLPLRNTKFGTVHYDWHWFWDYGCGDLGNQGIHQMDVGRWALNKNALANSVVSVGGRFGYIDDAETPNTQICVFDYGDCELVFEVRGLKTDRLLGVDIGNIVYGAEGYMAFTGYNTAIAFTPDGEVIQKFTGGKEQDHFNNFVKAVRSRKVGDLHADILEGHLSSALCHLGNISYRLGAEQPFRTGYTGLGDDKETTGTFERMEAHLKDNKVSPDESRYCIGRKLNFDPKTETFIGDKEADALLTREYRKGFELPIARA